MYSITAIVPVFNEESTVLKSLKRLDAIKEINKILIINDCSTDKSKEIIESYINLKKKFQLISLSRNRGKGHALNFAKQYISTSHIVIHDADLEYFPDDIKELIAVSVQNIDAMILGSRFIGNKERKNIYKRTYFANKFMSSFFSIIHNYKVSDIATCYKLMESSYFKQLDIKENGFTIEVEILAKFLKTNKFIIEVPIKYDGRSYKDGKKIKFTDGFKYLYGTIKYKIIN